MTESSRREHDLLPHAGCDKGLMTRAELDRALNPEAMTRPRGDPGTLPV